MMRFSLSILLLMVALIAVCTAWWWETRKLASEIQRLDLRHQELHDRLGTTIGRLDKAVNDEIGSLSHHPWAGQYYHGDGLGVNVSLSIAPQAGFVFMWTGCTGVYGRNFGDVVPNEGKILLNCVLANDRESFGGTPVEFIPVVWGGRRYLVPTDDMIGYCNQVNDGTEPRMSVYGSYLLRYGDENKTATGHPNVPLEFKKYLLAKPVEASITKIVGSTTRPSNGDWNFKDVSVTLDAGSEDGLLPGMAMHVLRPPDIVESLTILSVERDRAEAVMTLLDEEAEGPQVGWRLSTRSPRNSHLE